MHEAIQFLNENSVYFVFGVSVICVILLIWAIGLSRKVCTLTKKKNAKLSEGRVEDIISYLDDQAVMLTNIKKLVDTLDGDVQDTQVKLAKCFQNFGIVRFDAFEDVGGEQSFSVALLDGKQDGVIISSLYGRQDIRLYAKGIIKGEGERALSDEEKNALGKALNNK